MSSKRETQDPPLTFRKPRVEDGPAIYDLVTRSKPLDVNSRYLYLLLCAHFANTCAVVESDGELVAFVIGYSPPEQRETIFVWQIAVDASMRGHGIAHRLLDHLLDRPELSHVRFVEATVNPSNQASRSLFTSLAKSHGADFSERLFFSAGDFGGADHEEEILLRVGPLR